jgi:hypothetical protein
MTPELLAEIATAWREAFAGLRDGRPCDLCPAAAGPVRFLLLERDVSRRGLAGPAGQGLMGFDLVCDAGNARPPRQFEDRALDLVRSELSGRDLREPYWHPTVLGPRVGQAHAGEIPRRRSLESCWWCKAMMWVDDNAREQILADGGTPKFVCLPCADHPPPGQGIACVEVLNLPRPSSRT